ncbi:PLP-dependent aminotransferase family protein|uniref:2-aminoadipate transaminase n=1 Tax=Dendrosporobacter quercicolus TaxID=146817 RepID=A0A1G9L063_9FIRM|nr:PLP-dependent aminotransferase family protein [Dendrosporobacter quercicolus]NSL46548.1 PLP-dependent aminotransferase family protein [Dendrosporobacter quercicolus DSM 1736]SDL55342.1 2-aminoadipate transaminase [Dendrosporobacter quercicolus]
MTVVFADRMEFLRASEIREILKITQRPEVISFAGGLPAPELFPVEEMKCVALKVLEESGKQALQYSTTEGFEPLRKQIEVRLNKKFKVDVKYTNILITSGSQQALDLTGKLFLNPQDIVLCESPTYLAAISAFKAYKPNFIEVPTDDDGMIIGELEKILQTTVNIKFIYIIPDFQNPTGRTWSLDRRRQFIEVINQYEIPVIEDNAYGELRFEGEVLPAIKSFDSKGLVIFVSTFSKTFCPGLRIGWIAADTQFIEKYVLLKQAADLHTSSISQREISRYIELYDFEAHIKMLAEVYKGRRDAVVTAMQKFFPQNVRFTYPQGGLFTWVELPRHVSAKALLERCLKQNVAFVPGDSFFPNGRIENTFRLNYSNMPEERIYEGIRRLSKEIENY